MPNFSDKEMCVLHNENFPIYLRLGLKIKKLCRVLGFNQSHWLKGNIKFSKKLLLLYIIVSFRPVLWL